MPKFYEYKGFSFFVYSREHAPPHCHVEKSGRKYRITFDNIGGVLMPTISQTTRLKFSTAELEDVRDFARVYAGGIMVKWDDWVTGKRVKNEKIKKVG